MFQPRVSRQTAARLRLHLAPVIGENGNRPFNTPVYHCGKMPTLVRFLTVVVVLAALGAAAVVYLAYMVEPNTREMTIRIPPNKLTPPPEQ